MWFGFNIVKFFSKKLMKKLFCLILCWGLVLSCKTKNVVSEKEIDTTENNAPKDANLDLPMAEKVKFYQNTIVPPQFDQIKISSKLFSFILVFNQICKSDTFI